MRVGSFISSALLSVGLLMGCGGPDASGEQNVAPHTGSADQALTYCQQDCTRSLRICNSNATTQAEYDQCEAQATECFNTCAI